MDAFEIATAAEWDGDSEAFVEALIEAGFIDRDPDTNALYLHDWYDYAGKLIEAREAERERSRRRRRSEERRVGRACRASWAPSDDSNKDHRDRITSERRRH